MKLKFKVGDELKFKSDFTLDESGKFTITGITEDRYLTHDNCFLRFTDQNMVVLTSISKKRNKFKEEVSKIIND